MIIFLNVGPKKFDRGRDLRSKRESGWDAAAEILTPHIETTAEFREIFGLKNTLQKMLDVEAALAWAQAQVGLIPEAAAEEIERKARVEQIDPEKFLENYERTGHSVVAMVWALATACESGYGEYIHWGATTQDIIDTARNMQFREAIKIYLRDLKDILKILLDLAQKYKSTVMAGRTHAIQASPITFGYKVAVWASEFARHIERLEECRKRLLKGNITGAVGVFGAMAPMEREGPRIQELAVRRLGLEPALICTHSTKDNHSEFADNLARVAVSIAKVANEILNLQRTEISELEEPIPAGRVGSSTMPHKRNPTRCEHLIARSQIVKGLAEVVREGMMIEHERDFGWHTERLALPQVCMTVAVMLESFKTLVGGLVVKPENMYRNIRDVLLSEALMIVLAQKIGRQSAHELVYDAATRSQLQSLTLKEVVLNDEEIMKHLSLEEVDYAFDPAKHIGIAPEIVEKVVDTLRPMLKEEE